MTQSKEAEAIFTWRGPHVAGKVHVRRGTWTLEGCGDQCFLWIKQSNNRKNEPNRSRSRSEGRSHPLNNYAKLKVNI